MVAQGDSEGGTDPGTPEERTRRNPCKNRGNIYTQDPLKSRDVEWKQTPGLDHSPGAGFRDSSRSQPHPKGAPRSMGSPEEPLSPPLSSCFHRNVFSLFFPRNPLPEAQAGQALALHPFPPNTPLPTHPLLQLQALNTAFMVKHGIPFLFLKRPRRAARSSIPSPASLGMSSAPPPDPRGAQTPKKPRRGRAWLGAPGSREVTKEQGGDTGGDRHPREPPRAARRGCGHRVLPFPSLPPGTSSDG